MKERVLYITAIFNLKILGDLGEGINIRGGIYLTNNKSHIYSLMTDKLHNAIGNIEYNALLDANAVFYKISHDEISFENADDFLCDFLVNCRMIINELWLIKDHSINIMLGFSEYPYIKPSLIELPYHDSCINSNWITGGSHTSTGDNCISTFQISEVEQIISWGKNSLVEPFSKFKNRKTAIVPEIQRISRSLVFLQTARQQVDLGIKITHYCSAYECLFSTNSAELTHKLSERIAYFLETEPQKRIALYNDIKSIYSIRSSVTHGSSISEKYFKKISEYSQKSDNILRRILIKIQEKEYFDQFYRKDNGEKLEKFLLELTLGFDSSEIVTPTEK
ncbi:HEPN domain-containing protein [Cytophaga aurantiaca]|uniref:HEPN domain-containing protein n=1 Tax=Cytophaga aurantiaca TaxID=29530 RepID=UPI00035E6644|nr:HEPN domain-containing protein [Cytophaga aurantiaca]